MAYGFIACEKANIEYVTMQCVLAEKILSIFCMNKKVSPN